MRPALSIYKRRNEVERLFRRLKGYRRIFSRFEKLGVMYRAFPNFALIVDMIKCEHALLSKRFSVCFELTIGTGQRLGDCIGMKWSDF